MPRPVRTLVGAATRALTFGRHAEGRSFAWQGQAWEAYDEVPELANGLHYRADALSKLKLVIGRRKGGATKPEIVDNPPTICRVILDRLRNPAGGHEDLLWHLTLNLDIAADCYLVGLSRTETRAERWDIYSVEQVSFDGRFWRVKFMEDGDMVESVLNLPREEKTYDPDKPGDYLYRVMRRSSRRSWEPDSPVKHILRTVERLKVLEDQELSVSRSRIATAGLMALAQELEIEDPESQNDADGAPQEPGARFLYRMMSAAIRKRDAASAVVPGVIRVPADMIKEKSWADLMSFDRPVDDFLDERQANAVMRMARGMNLPVESMLGMMGTTFANSIQISIDEWRAYLEPTAIREVGSLTAGYFQPSLRAAAMDPTEASQWVIWYNEEAIVAKPDPLPVTIALYDRKLIGAKPARQRLGATEEEAPTDEDNAAWEKWEAAKANANMQKALLGKPGDDKEPTPDHPARGVGAGTGPAKQLAASATQGEHTDVGERLAELDRALLERLHSAAETQLLHVLRRSGNKIRQRARKDNELASLLNVPAERVAATLGHDRVRALGIAPEALISGQFDDLVQRFQKWTAEARALSFKALGPQYIPDSILQRRGQEADVEAARYLQEALEAAARAELFDGVTAAWSGPRSVLLAVSRAALAIAGGTQGLVRRLLGRSNNGAGPDIHVYSLSAERVPVSGPATGAIMQEAWKGAGYYAPRWRWDYGSLEDRETPFMPHYNLDKREFIGLDDPELDFSGNFPEGGHYHPGDHEGCLCRLAPALYLPSLQVRVVS